ncbi:hypothetical protein F4823DRAFT_587030 [Ustulina deusta]|nr:hypothetical protein F4823DRAFT_587030 [Ustulina deusta]
MGSRHKDYVVLVRLLLPVVRMRARPGVVRFGAIRMRMLMLLAVMVLLVQPQLLAMGRAGIGHNSFSTSSHAIYTISGFLIDVPPFCGPPSVSAFTPVAVAHERNVSTYDTAGGVELRRRFSCGASQVTWPCKWVEARRPSPRKGIPEVM